jgi:polyisoprenoid-binding protein YceI
MSREKWEIDSGHSSIHFSVRHLVVAKVRGKFTRWSGTLTAGEGGLERGMVDVVIDATSIDTGVPDRDAHLKSADFFDTANHPEITFRSRSSESAGEARLRLTGDLTIRGVTRPATLEVEDAGRTKDPWGNERAGFAAKTSVDRREFGLTWNQALEAGGVMVGERVDIEIDVEAVRQAETTVA